MNRLRSLLCGSLLMATGLTTAAGVGVAAGVEEDLAVVVNKSNNIENVTQAQLCKILLGQASWSSGKSVSVLLRASGPERETVLKGVCSMSSVAFMQQIMHSNGTAPKALASSAAIKQLLVTLPGSIGFLPMSEVTDAVHVVKLDGAAPGEAGYKLHAN